MARDETKAPPAPLPPAARQGDPEKDALRAQIEDLQRQLAAKERESAARPAVGGAAVPGNGKVRKRLWMVTQQELSLTTPSPFFAKEMPDDPRGKPIEAYDETEARAIFRSIHAIESGPQPACVEITEAEGQAAAEPPPVAKARKKAAQDRQPKRAGVLPGAAPTTQDRQLAAMM